MTGTQATTVVRHLRELVSADGPAPPTDRQLLERFLAARDEAAFRALVARHGPLVLGVCRRVLGSWHDAEDAFQAAFLVLANKAGAVRKPDALGSWLHGVACHVALRLREQRDARSRHERRAGRTAADPLDELSARELLAILDEEVQRLPEPCRGALVLCHLEGRTCDEAARRLGLSPRTLQRRLERGRDLLRLRLARRGVGLPAALLVTLLGRAGGAAVPAGLLDQAVRAALGAAGGNVAALAAAALVAPTVSRWKLSLALLAAVGAVGLVTALLAHPAAGQAKADPPPAMKAKAPAAEPGAGAKDERKDLVVTCSVRDAAKKPVAGADVILVGMRQPPRRDQEPRGQLLASGKTDAAGKCRLAAGASFADFRSLHVVAAAKGAALAWGEVDGEAAPQVDLTLRPAREVTGTLIDLQGQPAAGVRLRVHAADTARGEGWRMMKGGGGARLVDGRSIDGYAVQYTATRGLEFVHYPPPKGFPGWPDTVTTDSQGRFRIPGFAPEATLHLEVEDERFARQELVLKTADKPRAISLAPARWLEGQVVCGDTKRPLPGARLVARTHLERGVMTLEELQDAFGRGNFGPPALDRTEAKADGEGRFRLPLAVGDRATVDVFAPDGTPYLSVRREVRLARGAVKHKLDVALPRGVLFTGRVTEKASGEPLAGVEVFFLPQRDNNPGYRRDLLVGEQYPVFTGRDGRYQVAAPAQTGHLLLTGPGRDFIEVPVSRAALYDGKPGPPRRYDGRHGGEPVHFHAARHLDVKPQDGPRRLDLTLRRGVTIRGQVAGPDGKPLPRAVLFCAGELLWGQSGVMRLHYLDGDLGRAVLLEGGRFELRGCDPDRTYKVFFMDGAAGAEDRASDGVLLRALRDEPGRLGAVAELSARAAGGKPVTVTFQPCGAAEVRLLDAKGRPVRPAKDTGEGPSPPLQDGDGKVMERHLYLELIVAPPRDGIGEERVVVALPFRFRGGNPALLPDAEGRVRLRGLIPGATYRLRCYDPESPDDEGYPSVPFVRDFVAESGRTLRLPDVPLLRPR